MHNPIRVLAAAAALSLLPVVVSPVFAGDVATERDFFSRTASPEALDAQRGRANQDLTITAVDGAVHHNAAINTVNGTNTITNGSFANANGMATAIQNSGNNVLIQNATNLRIDLR